MLPVPAAPLTAAAAVPVLRNAESLQALDWEGGN